MKLFDTISVAEVHEKGLHGQVRNLPAPQTTAVLDGFGRVQFR